MLATKILIHPSVSDFLEELPTAVHYHLSPSAESHFPVTEKICNTLFQKKQVTPYNMVYLFIKQDERILVKYITNNHKEGQYIR